MQQYLSSSSEQDGLSDRFSLRERERSVLSLDDQLRGSQTARRSEYSFRQQDSDDSSAGSWRGRLCAPAEPVTAVNMKTGFSVVSLDLPSPANASSSSSRKTSTASSSSKSSYQKTSRKAKATVKKPVSTRDRKVKKTSSSKGVDEITEALCITPLVTPRDYLEDVDQATNSSSEDMDDDAAEVSC